MATTICNTDDFPEYGELDNLTELDGDLLTDWLDRRAAAMREIRRKIVVPTAPQAEEACPF